MTAKGLHHAESISAVPVVVNNTCEGCRSYGLRRECWRCSVSLDAMARDLLARAADAGGGHTAETVFGGHERVLRQTVIAMVAVQCSPSTRTPARRPCRCSVARFASWRVTSR